MADSARRPDAELRRDGPAPASATGKAAAQRRVNRIHAFRAELDALTAAGVANLSDGQREAITAYHNTILRRLAAEHDVDRTVAAGQLSRGMQIAAFITAIALTAAVYSLVERFWGRLDLPLQATLLCAFPLLALIAVELSAQRERSLYVASIFAVLAFATYWLAVFVLSSLLNVPVTTPALWGGALFGAALALPYGFRLIFGASLVAMLTALSGSVFEAAGAPWTVVPEFPEIITAAAFMLLIAAARVGLLHPAFAAVTRGVSLTVGFLGLLVLSVAGPASLLPVSAPVSELIYQAVLLLTSTLVLVLSVRRQWLESAYIAAVALTVFIFSRFFDWFWDLMPRFVFFLLLAAIAFGWLLALGRMRRRLRREELA